MLYRHLAPICLLLIALCLAPGTTVHAQDAASTPVIDEAATPSRDFIWPRLVEGMTLGNNNRAEVLAAAKTYGRYAQQTTRILARSSPYLWHILNAIEARNMPMEIALLPAIESGFDIDANSNRQASGLWQFMSGTAKLYGLADNSGYRARRDPIASTDAALTYLDRLHQEYGDWLLALAAYNAGVLRVNQAVQKAHSRNFWALKLPRETHKHINALLGLSQVVRHPERYGLRLPQIPDKPVTEAVSLSVPQDLAKAAEQAGVPTDSLAVYNPALRSLSNTTGQRTILMLPSDAEKLHPVLASADFPPQESVTTEESPDTAQVAAPVSASMHRKKHRVGPGETLWSIARRYGVSVDQLRLWNKLDKKKSLPRGRVLVVAS